jgi:hypothetical protein
MQICFKSYTKEIRKREFSKLKKKKLTCFIYAKIIIGKQHFY